MLEKLTPLQESKFEAYRNEWTEIGLSTEPANRAEAEDGIRLAYKLAGIKEPNQIVWCDSPVSMYLAEYSLKELKKQKVFDMNSNSVRISVWNSVSDSVSDSVRNSVRISVRNSVSDSVWNSVRNSVRNSVSDSVWNSVRNSVWNSVRNSVWNSVRNSVSDSVSDSVYGSHEAGWLSFYSFFYNECEIKDCQKLEGIWKVAKNAGWWLPLTDVCFISERHITLNRDEQGRLHCTDGPAVMYPDGWRVYAYHGVVLNNWDIIENRDKTTVGQIDKEQNQEVKRVMLELYGWDRYLIDSKAGIIHKDEFGELYRKEIPGDEPLVMVKVQNSSKEGLWVKENGEYKFYPAYNESGEEYHKHYMIRVPPTTKTAKGAVSWTFSRDEKTYTPIKQT